jgi:hypothetical protein
MELVFQVAVLIFLALIVLELQGLRSEFRKLALLPRAAEEKKDSPTINVNVGTLPLQPKVEAEGPAAGPASPPEAETGRPETGGSSAEAGGPPSPAEEEAEPEKPLAPPQPELRRVDVNATPSGLMVVKCSFCQAENSSFRNECFNCGKSLR